MSDSPGRTAPVCRAQSDADVQAGGDGQRMRGRAAEERAVGRGPLDVEVASCSHVNPMPPKDWIDSRQTRLWQSSLAALAMATAVRPGRRVLVDGGDGEVAQGAGPLEGEEHVAHLVLDRLERTDGDAELLALLDVGQQQLEEGVAGADRLERQPDGRLLEGAARSRAWRPRSRAHRGRGRRRDEDVVERGRGKGAARIERVHGVETGLGGRDDERAHAVAGPGDDDDLGGAARRPARRPSCRRGPSRRRPARRSW